MPPGVPVRHLDMPSKQLRVADCLFDVLIGMPWPAHPANPKTLLTGVKRDRFRERAVLYFSQTDAARCRAADGL